MVSAWPSAPAHPHRGKTIENCGFGFRTTSITTVTNTITAYWNWRSPRKRQSAAAAVTVAQNCRRHKKQLKSQHGACWT